MRRFLSNYFDLLLLLLLLSLLLLLLRLPVLANLYALHIVTSAKEVMRSMLSVRLSVIRFVSSITEEVVRSFH